MSFNVAIDGPGGAGKSSISKIVASKLNFIYVDTGALYRTIGLFFYRNNISVDDSGQIIENLYKINVDLKYCDNTQHVYLNGEDVSEDIRLHIVSEYASKVSAVPAVREFLLSMQREIAEKNNIIMDGRDIGSVVLPDADVKIFLTASEEVRAKRRYDELIAKGQDVVYADVLKDMINRDRRDEQREIAPLKKAEDAVLVDTSDCSFDESVERVLKVIRECMK